MLPSRLFHRPYYTRIVRPRITHLYQPSTLNSLPTTTAPTSNQLPTMRIACLQFNPALGDPDRNISRANELLATENSQNLDLLVLPEMAFSGYNFPDRSAITPFLEPTAAGITFKWASETAKRLHCHVVVGYPERATNPPPSSSVDFSDVTNPSVPTTSELDPTETLYNSALLVNPAGKLAAHYRKTFLYDTDKTWATPGPGFYSGHISSLGGESGTRIAMGICMDLNPEDFVEPWEKYEFANHCKDHDTELVIVSTAWLTHDAAEEVEATKDEPHEGTLKYWVARLQPLYTDLKIDGDEEGKEVGDRKQTRRTVFVACNRVGVEGDAVYAGTSTVLEMEKGVVRVHGLAGKGAEEMVVVDLPVGTK